MDRLFVCLLLKTMKKKRKSNTATITERSRIIREPLPHSVRAAESVESFTLATKRLSFIPSTVATFRSVNLFI